MVGGELGRDRPIGKIILSCTVACRSEPLHGSAISLRGKSFVQGPHEVYTRWAQHYGKIFKVREGTS